MASLAVVISPLYAHGKARRVLQDHRQIVPRRRQPGDSRPGASLPPPARDRRTPGLPRRQEWLEPPDRSGSPWERLDDIKPPDNEHSGRNSLVGWPVRSSGGD